MPPVSSGDGGSRALPLTWGPAAVLSVSAREARVQVASTTNPAGWSGAASNRAAFTDVVPKSMPRVTGREAMAAVTAEVQWLEQRASRGTLHRGGQRGGGASLPIFQPHATWRLLVFPLVKEGRLSHAATPGDRWRGDRRRDLVG